MVKTLVIYDDNGKIFSQVTGDYITPSGLQHLEIEVPQNKILKGVDVSVTPHQAILEDIPKSEVELLREQVSAQEQAIFDLAELLSGTVTE